MLPSLLVHYSATMTTITTIPPLSDVKHNFSTTLPFGFMKFMSIKGIILPHLGSTPAHNVNLKLPVGSLFHVSSRYFGI